MSIRGTQVSSHSDILVKHMPTVEATPKIERAKHQSRAMLTVLLCTFINAASQAFIKLGTATLGLHPTMLETAVGIVTKPLLFAGYSLLAVSTVLFVLALRKGDLSLLYPVLTLGYVWVTVLSVTMFHDSMNPFKIAGIAVIISGVAVLGRASNA
jgi:multidrug transporter EmrE-like cation transporter